MGLWGFCVIFQQWRTAPHIHFPYKRESMLEHLLCMLACQECNHHQLLSGLNEEIMIMAGYSNLLANVIRADQDPGSPTRDSIAA